MVLDRALATVPDSRNRALITELAYGYLRYKGRLDFVVDSFLSTPGRLPAKARNLLGLAAYELHFLDRVPDYATVSRAVDLARKNFGPGMSRLVNAVLRKVPGVDVDDPGFFQKDNPGRMLFWSRYYSCPHWLVKMWMQDFGQDLTHEYLRISLQKPATGIRLAPGMEDLELDSAWAVQRMGPSVLLRDNYPGLDDLEKKKLVFRQSFAGQKALWELGLKQWTSPVWDMCAGRGGKSLLMSTAGLSVWASDPDMSRLEGLAGLVRAQGQGMQVFAALGQKPPLKKRPKTILVDAPCSGLGVLGRRPDIKWKRTPGDVRYLSGLQKELLASAARFLPPDGEIVYLTCTLSRAENERQVEEFLLAHTDFEQLQTYMTPVEEGLGEFFFGIRMG